MKKIEIHSDALQSSLIDIPLFKSLTPAEIEDLSGIVDVYAFAKDELLITEGVVSNNLIAILEGSVEVLCKGSKNQPIKVGNLSMGAVAGETSLFSKEPATASVIASDDTIAIQLSQESFLSFINTHQRAGLKMLTFIIYGLMSKLRKSNEAMVMEKEWTVSRDDLENLKALFPPNIDEIIK